MEKDSKLKYPLIRILNILILLLFLFLTNLKGAEHIGLYLFYTIYLWIFIVLGIIEIRFLILNREEILKNNSLTINGWFFIFFVCSFILIVCNMIVLHT
ncbi:hypothetical protein [Flavisericum labens]|uniref:hypothetical protein n=1 Tax=Flavisericum labens TaxID=3377112 RepID=UPI00387AF52D